VTTASSASSRALGRDLGTRRVLSRLQTTRRVAGEEPLFDHIWTWLQVGNLRADFALAMDRSAARTRSSSLCRVPDSRLRRRLHARRGGFYRFFSYLNLFMFAMLTLVLADNFVLMFVGWEGVGLCSYLLIGYYFDKKKPATRRRKRSSRTVSATGVSSSA
jgi:NADH-quinone oxidoreductase subunit L